MNTALPVYRGELQCRMLGMAVDVFASDGRPCQPGQSGELVCTEAFPCQPVGFWPLPGFGADEKDVTGAQERYRKSYFAEFEGVWCESVCSCWYEFASEMKPYSVHSPECTPKHFLLFWTHISFICLTMQRHAAHTSC